MDNPSPPAKKSTSMKSASGVVQRSRRNRSRAMCASREHRRPDRLHLTSREPPRCYTFQGCQRLFDGRQNHFLFNLRNHEQPGATPLNATARIFSTGDTLRRTARAGMVSHQRHPPTYGGRHWWRSETLRVQPIRQHDFHPLGDVVHGMETTAHGGPAKSSPYPDAALRKHSPQTQHGIAAATIKAGTTRMHTYDFVILCPARHQQARHRPFAGLR